jgi:hypothetical protein
MPVSKIIDLTDTRLDVRGSVMRTTTRTLTAALAVAFAATPLFCQTLQEQKEWDKERAEAQKWVPPDTTPISEYSLENLKVVAYQYRIEFFDAFGQRTKSLSFKHPVEVKPHPISKDADTKSNLLVCTNPMGSYTGRTEEEQKVLYLRGNHDASMHWTNESGKITDFCGIITSTGEVIFEFPPPSFPKRLYWLIGVAGAGTRAALLVGEKIHEKASDTEDMDEGDRIGKFTEVWIWEYPKTVRKLPFKTEYLRGNTLISLLREGKL